MPRAGHDVYHEGTEGERTCRYLFHLRLLGVTEPAIFGVNVRHKYPFIFGMIGSGIAGVSLAVNNVLASSIGVGGIPGFLSIFPNQWGVFFIGMVIVLVIPFTGTLLFGRYQLSKQSRRTTEGNPAGSDAENKLFQQH